MVQPRNGSEGLNVNRSDTGQASEQDLAECYCVSPRVTPETVSDMCRNLPCGRPGHPRPSRPQVRSSTDSPKDRVVGGPVASRATRLAKLGPGAGSRTLGMTGDTVGEARRGWLSLRGRPESLGEVLNNDDCWGLPPAQGIMPTVGRPLVNCSAPS